MNYPALDIPTLGGGFLIASIAILHVFIAHFAVGAGLFTAACETAARRRGDALLLRFLRDHSRVLVLLAFVLGAASGAGVWFSIAVVAPRATSLLIHNFVFAWAIEWVFFAIEITAGYVYYASWDRLAPSRHVAVGWIYAAAAWLSLFAINGIITFMLTPGRWLERRAADDWSGAFFSGFFNPTFWPSLLLRTLSCLALAGLFVCVIVNLAPGYGREERKRVIRAALYFVAPIVLMVPAALWYFGHVPAFARQLVAGGAAAMSLFLVFGVVCSVLISAYALALIRTRGYLSLTSSVLLLAMAFVATGTMEYVREGIRKPYVVRGYLWSNGVANRPAEFTPINRDGLLAHAPWHALRAGGAALDSVQRGEILFRAQCAACHTVDGLNGVAPLVYGWRRDWIRQCLDHLDELKGYMPPCLGTPAERDALADWLFQLNPAHRGDDAPDLPVASAAAPRRARLEPGAVEAQP
ncbi:MAG: cytochrome ubiquinol oxidase subunit I [Phycisphaerae bacterium]